MSGQSEYLGMDTAFGGSVDRPEPILPADVGRVLVVMMDHHLGNLVIGLPIAAALAEHFDEPIDLLIDARWAGLATQLSHLGHIHRYPPRCKGLRRYVANTGQLARLWATLAGRRYRAVIDATGNIRSTTWCVAAGCRTRVGLADARRAWIYSHRIDASDATHTYDRHAALLRSIGRTDRPEPLKLVAQHESHERVADELERAFGPAQGNHPLIVLHPSAGKAYRRWPSDRFAAVADGLVERADARIAIIGTPDERGLGEGVRDQMRHRDHAHYFTLTVVDLLALFERAALIVSNESGPTHLAAATGLPIVTIFGPTPEAVWRPLRDRDTVMLRGTTCDPRCGRRVCVAEHQCLLALSTDHVLEQALHALENAAPPARHEAPQRHADPSAAV